MNPPPSAGGLARKALAALTVAPPAMADKAGDVYKAAIAKAKQKRAAALDRCKDKPTKAKRKACKTKANDAFAKAKQKAMAKRDKAARRPPTRAATRAERPSPRPSSARR